MADPFGRLDEPDEEAPDFLGAQVPIAFKGQPALPVTGGPAIGSPTAPVTEAGFAPTPAPSTVTGQPTTPLGGGEAPGGGEAGGAGGGGGAAGGINFGAFVEPAIKLGNLAQQLFPSDLGPAGARPTEFGTLSNTSPDVLSGQYNPPPPPTELAGGGGGAVPFVEPPSEGFVAPEGGVGGMDLGGFTPPPTTPAPSFTTPSGDPIPDELVNMFGGDRGAIEAAVQQASGSVTPEMIAAMADAGELSGLGIDSAAGLSQVDVASLSSGIGIAGLILTGLKLAGIAEGEAARVAGSMLSVVSGGVALSQALPSLVSLGAIAPETATALGVTGTAAATTAGSVGAVAGGVTAVLAPLIAWGMHELEAAMRPNTLPATRAANEQLFNATTGQVGEFNDLFARAQAQGISDPATLNALLNAGQKSMLDFYNTWVGVGQDIPGVGRDASPSGQVGGFDPATQGEMMAPYRQAMMNVAALDQMLGSQAQGSNDWYGIFGAQLDPRQLNLAMYGPGNESENPLGLNAAQYGEKFTPEQLRAAAGGLDPLDYAIQQWGV